MRSTKHLVMIGGILLLAVLVLALAHGLTDSVLAQGSPTATPNINWVNQPQGINVRSGPGLEYDVLGALPVGSWIQPLARSVDGEWVLITYLYSQGWVQVDGVTWRLNTAALPVIEQPSPTAIPPLLYYNTPGGPTVTPNANWVDVGAEGVFVRSGPGQGYAPLGELFTGDVVDPVAHDRALDWVLIRFGSGYGWLRYDMVVWTENIEALAEVDVPELTPSFTAVPNIRPSRTPTATLTPSLTPSPTATDTPSLTPTDTPTAPPTAPPTDTPTETPTQTPTETATGTPSGTPSGTPTSTPTETASPMPTATLAPTDTLTAVPSQTPTETPVPAAAFTALPTETATEIPPSATPVPSATDTAVPQAAAPVATSSPSPSVTPFPSPTPAVTASPAPTETPIPTETPSLPPSATASPLPTVTATPVVPTATPQVAAVAGNPPDDAGNNPDSAGSDPQPELITIRTPDQESGSPPVVPVIGGVVAALGALAYVVVYVRQAAIVARYREGFVLAWCPVCQEGQLAVEDRRYRMVGIPRVRRVVRCNVCRSVLRQVGPHHWRYAVDRNANPDLYEALNNQVFSEDDLIALLPHDQEAPPHYIDDEDDAY